MDEFLVVFFFVPTRDGLFLFLNIFFLTILLGI
jgi:hypothetical protein